MTPSPPGLRAALQLSLVLSFAACGLAEGTVELPGDDTFIGAQNGASPGDAPADPGAPGQAESWQALTAAYNAGLTATGDGSFTGDPDAARLIGLVPGMVSSDGRIKQLQDDLIALAYLAQSIKTNAGYGNTFGPMTTSAVKRFQTDHALAPIGEIDVATADALRDPFGNGPAVPPAYPGAPPADPNGRLLVGLKPGVPLSQAARVRQLHDDLLAMGYLEASFRSNDGYGRYYGPLTTAAVKQFQAENGTPITGAIDPATGVALVSPRPRPAGAAIAPAELYRAELGLAVGPLTALVDGSQQQDFDRGHVLATPAGVLYVRRADGSDLAPPRRLGPAVTVAEANQSFLTQWGPTAWNRVNGAPNGYLNCGPTSAAIVLSMLGHIPHPSPAEAEQVIVAMRQASGVLNKNYGMGDSAVARVLTTYGARPTIRRPIDLGIIDASLAAGHPLILGTSRTWLAWGQGLRAQGSYLNNGDPGGHFVTLLGKTLSAGYLVGDPLSKIGAIEVTSSQLTTALGGAWSAIEVAR